LPDPASQAVRPLPPWACTLPTWLALPPRPLPVRNGLPQFQGALRLLSGPHRVEWLPWVQSDPMPHVRDHHLAHSPTAGLLWVCCEPAPVPRWWLLGWWA
jgi:protein ImuB